jgi:hypothetical protein
MTVATPPAGAAFGVWHSLGTFGSEIYNEPGALVWVFCAAPCRVIAAVA